MKRPEPGEANALRSVLVQAVHGLPELDWAQGLRFCVPQEFFEQAGLGRLTEGEDTVTLTADLKRPGPEVVEHVRRHAAFTETNPASSRLPFSYQFIPAAVRSWIARFLGRRQRARQERWAKFPRWPLDLSADFLADWCFGPSARFLAGPTPVVLSHDLDSPEGLRNLVRDFLPLEEQAGARSTSFIVPCAWAIDHGLLREVRDRGHELGIHGYDHSNRTSFVTPAERDRRLGASRPLVEQYEMLGYRAPSLLRSQALLSDLPRHFRYDSSMPTSGGLFPVPNNGCASARPFWINDLIELPLSLPRDGSLLFLGHQPQEIADLWLACAEQIARSGGVVVLLTHCEARFSGNPAMRRAYAQFLKAIADSPGFAWATAEQVVRQFRAGAPGQMRSLKRAG